MKQLTPNTFDQTDASKVALVDFFSTTCPPCRQLMKILDPLAEEMASQLDFFTFNIEDDETGDLLDQFQIDAVPTLVILKNGTEVARQEGALPKAALKAWIEENIA